MVLNKIITFLMMTQMCSIGSFSVQYCRPKPVYLVQYVKSHWSQALDLLVRFKLVVCGKYVYLPN